MEICGSDKRKELPSTICNKSRVWVGDKHFININARAQNLKQLRITQHILVPPTHQHVQQSFVVFAIHYVSTFTFP